MVAAVVLLLQLPPAPHASDLPSVRAALGAADTAAAVALLRAAAMQPALSPDGLAAIVLLDWIARSRTQDAAGRAWHDALAHHRRAWEAAKRGAVLLPVREERLGDLLQIAGALRLDRPLALQQLTETFARDWRAVLDDMLHAGDDRDRMLRAAARWVRLGERLAGLDSLAEDFYGSRGRGIRSAGLAAQEPPGQYRLLAHFADGPAMAGLDEVATLTAGLADAPWPFDALGARAHVTLCALLRANPGVAGCWPDGRAIGGRDGAEVRALALGASGRHGLAAMVMDETPAWFTPLDARRGVIDPRRPGTAEPDSLSTGTFWRVAWPLYLQPFNERLTVHRVRLLLADAAARLARGTRGGLFSPLGDPVLLVRVGVPLAIGDGRVFVSPATHETIVGPAPDRWAPLDLYVAAGADDARYLSGFVSEDYDSLTARDHQLVAYLRDGQRWIDIHTAWWPPPACEASRPLLGLFLLDERQRPLRTELEIDPASHPRRRFRYALPPGTYVYSLELLDRPCRAAERARYVIRVPEADGGLLSDLMLAEALHGGDDRRAADRLEDREPVTLSPSLFVAAGGVARFYWEMYGVTADGMDAERVDVRFEVLNLRSGRIPIRDLRAAADQAARASGALHLAYRITVPPGTAPLVSGLAVGLPREARGTYVARLRVTDRATGRTAVAQRAFFVRG